MKIFVSHSARDDAYAAMVREQVRVLLPSGDTLLVDEGRIRLWHDIRPGQEWCALLYDWLASCDAAMILMNREALKSAWVRREACGVPEIGHRS